MSANAIILNDVRCTIKLLDGTSPTPLDHVMDADTGSFSVGPLKETLNETEPVQRKGRLYGLAPAARIFPTGSFECYLGLLSDASAETAHAMVLGAAPFAARVSTLGANHHEVGLDIEVTWNVPGGTDQVLLLTDCVVTIDTMAEGSPVNLVSGSFVCYGTVSMNGTVICDEIA
jgi:hypothetical protein